mmetsp:Transcript_17461/g.30331  ORF Transcript_17461/g.30331 Transcript_17461/m.30331 type:complete len:122 (-) Transcript_17461:383-748(-)
MHADSCTRPPWVSCRRRHVHAVGPGVGVVPPLLIFQMSTRLHSQLLVLPHGLRWTEVAKFAFTSQPAAVLLPVEICTRITSSTCMRQFHFRLPLWVHKRKDRVFHQEARGGGRPEALRAFR